MRKNVDDGRKPSFGLYEDQISVMLERAWHTWEGNGWRKKNSRCVISAKYFVDFSLMKQVSIYEFDKQRPVKRGKQGERNVRPNNQKFMSYTYFSLSQKRKEITFDPIIDGTGGSWLGFAYLESINGDKSKVTVQTVKQGIIKHQRI